MAGGKPFIVSSTSGLQVLAGADEAWSVPGRCGTDSREPERCLRRISADDT
jgi:hypothetical protein